MKLFEYICNSLELVEVEYLDFEFIFLREEELGLFLRLSFGKLGDDLLKEVDKIVLKKWLISGVLKKGLGLDFG